MLIKRQMGKASLFEQTELFFNLSFFRKKYAIAPSHLFLTEKLFETPVFIYRLEFFSYVDSFCSIYFGIGPKYTCLFSHCMYHIGTTLLISAQ